MGGFPPHTLRHFFGWLPPGGGWRFHAPWRAHPRPPCRPDHGVFQHQRPGGHHGIFCPPRRRSSPAHTMIKAPSPPYSHAPLHCGRWIHFCRSLPPGRPGVQHGVVLDIAVLPMRMAPVSPRTTRRTTTTLLPAASNIPGQGGVVLNKGCTANIRRFAVYCDNCHNFTSCPE